jgi:nitrogen fixation NifU-like protein
MDYNKKVLERFTKPKNVGEMEDADGVGKVGNVKCGDMMVVYIKVRNNKISKIRFKTYGCVSAIAASDIMCDMAKGKTLAEAEKITNKEITESLGGLPPIKHHCSVLGAQALKAAIKDYRKKQKKISS